MSSCPPQSKIEASEEDAECSTSAETAEQRRRDSVDPGPEHEISEAFFDEGERRYSQPPPDAPTEASAAPDDVSLATVLAAQSVLSAEDRRARRVIVWSLSVFFCVSAAFLLYNKWYLPQPAPLVSRAGIPVGGTEGSARAAVATPEAAPDETSRAKEATETRAFARPSNEATGSADAPLVAEGAEATSSSGSVEDSAVAQSGSDEPVDPNEEEVRSETEGEGKGEVAVPEEASSAGDMLQNIEANVATAPPPPGTPQVDTQPATLTDVNALEIAEQELKRGRLRSAAAKFQALIDREGSDAATALSGLAMVKLQQSKSTEAEGFARRAVDADPSDSRGWIVLGAALQELGRRQEAFEAYAACVRQGSGAYVTECRRMRR